MMHINFLIRILEQPSRADESAPIRISLRKVHHHPLGRGQAESSQMAMVRQEESPHIRTIQTAHTYTQKTCTQQINCCAKKYRSKWRIDGAYSIISRKSEQ